MVFDSAFLLLLLTLLALFYAWRANRRCARLEQQVETLRQLSRSENSPGSVHTSETISPDHTVNPPSPGWSAEKALKNRDQSSLLESLLVPIKQYWMAWLGGICLALAGIFLVRYSIEQGLLSPRARILVAVFAGVLLHLIAYILRRRWLPIVPVAISAMAGAGSITLFAAILGAVHLYNLLAITPAFLLLGLVALVTMWCALFYGPLLALIGILGAYWVPLALGEPVADIHFKLVYACLITASVLGVIRYVYRSWLWLGMLIGCLFWWAIGQTQSVGLVWPGGYLAGLAYLILAVPTGNWLLFQRQCFPDKKFPLKRSLRHFLLPEDMALPGLQVWSISLVVLALVMSVFSYGMQQPWLVGWLPLVLIILWVSGRQEQLTFASAILLLALAVSWLLLQVSWSNGFTVIPLMPSLQQPWQWIWLGIAVVTVAMALLHYHQHRFQSYWAALGMLTPLLLLSLAYLLRSPESERWIWAGVAVLMGLLQLLFARLLLHSSRYRPLSIWLHIAGHCAFSLMIIMLLQQASFTLAIAIQAGILAVTMRRFSMPELEPLLRLLLTVVLLRLTLQPWLFQAQQSLIWLMLSYLGATACAAFCARVLVLWPAQQRWSEGVAVHLMALSLWVLCRYYVYSGNPFVASLQPLELALNIGLFGGLSLIYYWRSDLTVTLKSFYRIYSHVLMAAAGVSYGILLLALAASSPWLMDSIGERFLWNSMLLSFGLPVGVAVLATRFYVQELRWFMWSLAGFAGWCFISLQIRHFWQGTISLELPFEHAELYTYSLVWLLMALGAMLLGLMRFGVACYRAGIILLGLVIIKLFLIDMAGLSGLLRVLSFMGMGLCLLGVSYLHQSLVLRLQTASADKTSAI